MDNIQIKLTLCGERIVMSFIVLLPFILFFEVVVVLFGKAGGGCSFSFYCEMVLM